MIQRFQTRLPWLLAVLLFLAAPALRATTVAPPANLGELARLSQAVVFAQAIDSRVEEDSDIPYTITRFQSLRRVGGADPGSLFEVREPGGAGENRAARIAGAPRYEEGRSYLLFLDTAPEGRWQSKMMAYGLLVEDPASGLLEPLPEASRIEKVTTRTIEPVAAYPKEALLQQLRAVVQDGASWNGGIALPVAAPREVAVTSTADLAAPASCQLMLHQDGVPIRFFGYETGAASQVMATTPGQTGLADGGAGAVQAGVAAWANHPDALIRFVYGGTRARNLTCTGGFDYEQGGVVFNDPCGEIPDLSGCTGTLAFGGSTYDPVTTRLYDGTPWHPAQTVFAVVNNGAQCVGDLNFREVLAHELGHAQGFGHHNPANPADALMSALLKGGIGASLRPVDKVCADFVYHTFLDVPTSRWSWRSIEAIQNARIDTGCGGGSYCPTSVVNRAGLAVFLVRGRHGGTFVPPPATGTVFADVPASYPQAAYIEQLYRDGMTSGCSTSPRLYCPSTPVSRAQMAVFLLQIAHGTSYVPPAATGRVFQDVAAGYWAAAYIERLFAEGGTGGCATHPLRYCPETPLTREEIAGFLALAYHLPLP